MDVLPDDYRGLQFPDNLILAILVRAVEDIRSPRHRLDVLRSLRDGTLDAWIGRMAVSYEAQDRVRLLLEELAREPR